MLLTQTEFEARKAKGTLRIALIGMSNIGKSHWTRDIVRRHGFESYEVDEAIQERLDVDNIEQSAAHMGQPYDKDYQNRVQEYLALEEEMTLESESVRGNMVLDTTGSVIHLSNATTNIIKNKHLIVYICANESQIETLVQRFATSPKPLIWGELYKKQSGMSDHESMMSSYPALLKQRDNSYSAMTDIEIMADDLMNKANCDFLEVIETALPAS